ncbi:MAG: hypothetical protein LBB68_00965 [Treponema sp.]|jgi:hypothetical protein|nr:hypothetical protein [Treponema sp.]
MKLRKLWGNCAVLMLISAAAFAGGKKEAVSGVTITVASVNNPDMVIYGRVKREIYGADWH